MKTTITNVALFVGAAVAHSAVWSIDVDGINYPARDVRMDGRLGAKRVEWTASDTGLAPIVGVEDPGLACGKNASAPALKAVARAGAQVTVQWSGIVRAHFGPVLSYLAPLPAPDTKAQDLKFFKIAEAAYNTTTRLWANEVVKNADRKDTFQLPSDIKPGMYTLRTELVALHYVAEQGPEFYPHCFNIEIQGNGDKTPDGIRFPGAYSKTDMGLYQSLWTSTGIERDWAYYTIPGPPRYAGAYSAPSGPAPTRTDAERGLFPPEFQAKYEAFRKITEAEALLYIQRLNNEQEMVRHGKPGRLEDNAVIVAAMKEHGKAQKEIEVQLQQLKAEGIKMGVVTS